MKRERERDSERVIVRWKSKKKVFRLKYSLKISNVFQFECCLPSLIVVILVNIYVYTFVFILIVYNYLHKFSLNQCSLLCLSKYVCVR